MDYSNVFDKPRPKYMLELLGKFHLFGSYFRIMPNLYWQKKQPVYCYKMNSVKQNQN